MFAEVKAYAQRTAAILKAENVGGNPDLDLIIRTDLFYVCPVLALMKNCYGSNGP